MFDSLMIHAELCRQRMVTGKVLIARFITVLHHIFECEGLRKKHAFIIKSYAHLEAPLHLTHAII